MKNIKTLIVSAALLLVGAITQAAPTTNIEIFSVTIASGYKGQTVICPTNSNYYGWAKMTNSSGTYLMIPPAGTTQGTFTDLSGYPANYTSTQVVQRRSDLHVWEGCGSVTFPVNTGTNYTLVNYINAPYPNNATNMIITLQVVWQ